MVTVSRVGASGEARAPLAAVLGVTFLASISGGSFWAGIFFVTAAAYRFSAVRNLVLGAAMGAVYALAAFAAGPAQRWAARIMSTRALLAVLLVAWSLAGFVVVALPSSQATLWAAALLGAATSAAIWPVVESYLGSGRHGHAMHAAVGLFNITWTPAVALPLLVLPLFPRDAIAWALALSGAASALAIPIVWGLPRHPAPHDAVTPELDQQAPAPHPASAIGAVPSRTAAYPFLLRASRWLLPLSYLMSANIAPVLPYRLARLGTSGTPDSVVAATWMLARFLALFAMWRLHAWRGRWSTLVAAAVALAGGLGTVLFAPSLVFLILGLALFGLGMGLVYYASLYYALSVGKGAVDAGGSFEGLIGLGYAVGPLLGLAGRLWTGNGATGTAVDTGGGAPGAAITVVLVWLAAALAFWFVGRAFRQARRRVRGETISDPRVTAAG